jgi:hypothetical protein
MHIMKRGMLALSVLAAVGGTTGGLLASQAGAQPTRGPEVVRVTQYYVGGGKGVGPFTSHGAVNTKGNITDIASLMADPPDSGRSTLVDPTGSFTVLTTGGDNFRDHLNPVTCALTASVQDIHVVIVSGTGAYRHATGTFKASVHVNGFVQRLANEKCDLNGDDPTAFETDTAVAVGHINLN